MNKLNVRFALSSAIILGLLLAALSTDVHARSEEFLYWNDLPEFETPLNDKRMRLGGRFDFEIGRIDSDTEGEETETDWRRARLSLSGRPYKDWRYLFIYDFSADSDNAVIDSWVSYHGFDNKRLRFGYQPVPVGFEERTGSKATLFMERALTSALTPGYKLGLSADHRGGDWTASLGLFEGELQDRDSDNRSGLALAGRVTYLPKLARDTLIHIGASTEIREASDNKQLRISARPETRLTSRRLVSTGTLNDVSSQRTFGLEAAGVWNKLSLQGEYLYLDVSRSGRPDVSFDSWYIAGSWFLYGGPRLYDRRDGTFDPLRVAGEKGALEIALRYSNIDLEEAPITGGEQRDWTVGVNWYMNRRMRLMLNWIDAKASPNRSGDPESLEAWQIRLQYSF